MAIGDETTGFEYTIGNGGPDPVAALLATNFHTLALESGDSMLSNDDNTETEYYFNGVSITVASSVGLSGFSVSARYYVDTEEANPAYDPDNPDSGEPETIIVRTYPAWTLNSSSFTVSAEGAPGDRPIFLTTTNAESLYTPEPSSEVGNYGTATAGIIDNSQYIYTKVFNLSQFDFIPRLSPGNQEIVTPSNGAFPNTPNDPANNIYPINTVCSYAPDPRRQVLLTYSYSLNYTVGTEVNASAGITIEQYVSQPLNNAGEVLKQLLADSYYGKGFYGLDQWPVDEPALYDHDGTAIAPIPRVDYTVPDSSTSSGYAEYDQNTNGAGMPLVIDATTADQVVIPEESYVDDGQGIHIDGVDYNNDTYDNDVIPFD